MQYQPIYAFTGDERLLLLHEKPEKIQEITLQQRSALTGRGQKVAGCPWEKDGHYGETLLINEDGSTIVSLMQWS